MDDNDLYAVIWKLIVGFAISIVICVTAYNIVDRIGPQRPIVTQTTQYQAK